MTRRTLHVSAEDLEALRSGRLQPPDPRVHVCLEALSWRSQRRATPAILQLGGMAKASVHRSLKAEVTGGLAQWKQSDHELFWSWLSQLWPSWRTALAFVQPRTVIAWQRQRFRDHWRRLSQRRCTP